MNKQVHVYNKNDKKPNHFHGLSPPTVGINWGGGGGVASWALKLDNNPKKDCLSDSLQLFPIKVIP